MSQRRTWIPVAIAIAVAVGVALSSRTNDTATNNGNGGAGEGPVMGSSAPALGNQEGAMTGLATEQGRAPIMSEGEDQSGGGSQRPEKHPGPALPRIRPREPKPEPSVTEPLKPVVPARPSTPQRENPGSH